VSGTGGAVAAPRVAPEAAALTLERPRAVLAAVAPGPTVSRPSRRRPVLGGLHHVYERAA